MTRALTFLFAVAGGVAAGSLYFAQPLLEVIATEFDVSVSAAGLLITMTQLGYALGILLVVPLGDLLARKRLIPATMVLASLALAACALAPSFPSLVLASIALGLTSVAGQLLTPLASDLAAPDKRGAVVGTVVSGLITGILVARIFSGGLASLAGWRAVFVVGAGLALLLAGLLFAFIPARSENPDHIPYRTLVGSVFRLVQRNRTLQVSMILGASGFGLFTMFWTALTFLLSSEPFGYPTWVIGLFGIAGLAGAIAAQSAGRLHDRGWNVMSTSAGWLLIAASWVVADIAGFVLPVLILCIVALDIGTQGQNILNQSRVFAQVPEARSRVNTAYITGNFAGGAIGSVGATLLWSAGGWHAVCATGVIVGASCLIVIAVTGRTSLAAPAPSISGP